MKRWWWVWLLLLGAVAAGCAQLIGIDEPQLAEVTFDAAPGGTDAAAGVDADPAAPDADPAAPDAAPAAPDAAPGPADAAAGPADAAPSPVDAAPLPDAGPPPSINDVTLDDFVPTSSSASVSVQVTAVPNQALTFSCSTGGAGGMFSPASGMVNANGAGQAIINTSYLAPATSGDRNLSVMVSNGLGQSDSAMFVAKVRVIVNRGFDVVFGMQGTDAAFADVLIAEKINVPVAGTLLKLGTIGAVNGASVKLALYTDAAGQPGTLFVQSVAFTLPAGRLEIDVTPKAIPAGDYWIAALPQTDARIARNKNGVGDVVLFFTSQAFAGAFPTSFPAGASSVSLGPFNVYAVVAQ